MEYRNRSYEIVGYFKLRKMYTKSHEQALCCVQRQDRDWLEEQDFPQIHRIVLDLSSRSLESELDEHPSAVFDIDAQGRTALDWATARAQLDQMRRLITFGSDANSMDITGRTTILHAVDSYSVEALRIVLEAGACPDPKIPEGLLRGSPLTSACLNSLPGMVSLLLEFGADIDAPNPEGLTALHSAAISQNIDCARILLEQGANLGYLAANGRSPLMTAMIHNSHSILRLFLSRSVDRFDGAQLLPTIAKYADSETMSILSLSDCFYLVEPDNVSSCRAILQFRVDYDNTLNLAFDAMISACTGAVPMGACVL